MGNKLNIGDFVKYRTHRGQIINIRDPWECPYTDLTSISNPLQNGEKIN